MFKKKLKTRQVLLWGLLSYLVLVIALAILG